VDLGDLIGDLAGLEAPVRQRVVDVALAGCADDATAAADLHRLREALRERHPLAVVGPASPPGCTVELFARLDEHRWYLRGWVGLPPDRVRSLVLVSPLGERIDLRATSVRTTRSDVDGFYRTGPHLDGAGLGLVATARATHRAPGDGWILELGSADGTTVETPCPAPAVDPDEVRRLLLAELVLDRPGDDRVLTAVLHDALQTVESHRRRGVRLATVDVHGRPPAAPEVSVVVPLYGRLDLFEHQLAEFVHDPAMHEVDLVVVLDDPDHGDAFRAEARRLHRLYGVPFRLGVVNVNAGFSGATNLGAELARGRLLLLCNSDVLPDEPGWLPRLVHFHDHLPAVGAVSPKLVFEDGSLQHAGMYFDRPPGEPLWGNEHYFKGLHRDFPPATVSRPVPAVTAACLLTDRRLYEDLGGLRGQYLQGDFEDSDYCLRLRTAGRDCWYAADVELLHLEGMSYPSEVRAAMSRYNRWLHTQLWDPVITDVMADPAFHPARVAAEYAEGTR
jgi:GT2 family glycosyltransferase